MTDKQIVAQIRDIIDRYQIGCAETIWQTDRIQEAAPHILEEICDMVGYCEIKESEDED